MAIETGTDTVKRGLAQMLKGGVIMDVVSVRSAAAIHEHRLESQHVHDVDVAA